jgi:hypothetical protein
MELTFTISFNSHLDISVTEILCMGDRDTIIDSKESIDRGVWVIVGTVFAEGYNAFHH